MAQSRHDLIFHPVRYSILRALNGNNLTTQAITEVLGDVPQSTIYRHLKLLLQADMISIVDSREINGITEKIYGAQAQYHLTAEEFAALSPDEHVANMELFAMSVMQSFATAMEHTETEEFSEMPISYREYSFYATEEEFLEIRRTIFKLLRNAEKRHNSDDEQRRNYKINISTYRTPY